MKKNYLSILALLVTVILVVGCNTTEKTEDNDSNENTPSNSATQETPGDSEADVDDQQDSSTQTDTNTSSISKQEIVYKQNGVDKTETATELQSADQDYKLHQLPGFTHSPEEPGKDIYVSNDDDQVFMRVETISTAENSYEDIKSSLIEYMNAVGTTTPLSADMLEVFKEAKSVEGYEVKFEDEGEKVVGVVIEKDNLIVKLTIHDNDAQDLTAAMLAMAATITKK